jgi:hypothetical protein
MELLETPNELPTKKRKSNQKSKKTTKRQKPQLTPIEANDAAGFVPNEITGLIQRGFTHAEALVRLLELWPDSNGSPGSANMFRRLEKRLSRKGLNELDEKQRAELKSKLDADLSLDTNGFMKFPSRHPTFVMAIFISSRFNKHLGR